MAAKWELFDGGFRLRPGSAWQATAWQCDCNHGWHWTVELDGAEHSSGAAGSLAGAQYDAEQAIRAACQSVIASLPSSMAAQKGAP